MPTWRPAASRSGASSQRVDQAAGFGHKPRLAFGQGRLVRLAAQAGAKAGRFGRLRALA
jgi:hypothetical protein